MHMSGLQRLLAQAAEITEKRMAVITRNERLVCPEGFPMDITYEEACKNVGKNYKGWNIYAPEDNSISFFLCISSDKYYEWEAGKLVMLLLSSAFEKNDYASMYLKKALSGNYDTEELLIIEENLKHCLPGYVLLIDNIEDSRDDILEVLANTMDIKASLIDENRIIAVAEGENIVESCSSFVKNVLSELLIECNAAIGGKAAKASELCLLYRNCMEALSLKHIYGLADNVLDYDGMYGYRVAYNLNPGLKEFLKKKVFTDEFSDMVKGELGITIEEFFRNNLNLTDTAAKLYIHRNTLLYRLDKIYKCTGFDLKKFEDSWLFRLAWMVFKER